MDGDANPTENPSSPPPTAAERMLDMQLTTDNGNPATPPFHHSRSFRTTISPGSAVAGDAQTNDDTTPFNPFLMHHPFSNTAVPTPTNPFLAQNPFAIANVNAAAANNAAADNDAHLIDPILDHLLTSLANAASTAAPLLPTATGAVRARLQAALQPVLDARTAALEAELDRMRATWVDQDARIDEQGEQLRDQSEQMRDQDEIIRDLGVELRQQEMQIEEQETQIREQETQIQEQVTQLREQETQIQEQVTQLRGAAVTTTRYERLIENLRSSVRRASNDVDERYVENVRILREADDREREAEARIAQQDELIAQLDERIGERNERIEERDERIAQQERITADQERDIAEQRGRIADHERTMHESTMHIIDQRIVIHARDDRIAELEELNREHEELNQENEERIQELEELTQQYQERIAELEVDAKSEGLSEAVKPEDPLQEMDQDEHAQQPVVDEDEELYQHAQQPVFDDDEELYQHAQQPVFDDDEEMGGMMGGDEEEHPQQEGSQQEEPQQEEPQQEEQEQEQEQEQEEPQHNASTSASPYTSTTPIQPPQPQQPEEETQQEQRVTRSTHRQMQTRRSEVPRLRSVFRTMQHQLDHTPDFAFAAESAAGSRRFLLDAQLVDREQVAAQLDEVTTTDADADDNATSAPANAAATARAASDADAIASGALAQACDFLLARMVLHAPGGDVSIDPLECGVAAARALDQQLSQVLVDRERAERSARWADPEGTLMPSYCLHGAVVGRRPPRFDNGVGRACRECMSSGHACVVRRYGLLVVLPRCDPDEGDWREADMWVGDISRHKRRKTQH
ncbi:hypothetical protein UCDDS831_g05347 [Diplodia seriata]|uniref:Uncharacterized protein n=1 Tax=Diplodia seriata TaxID=420778 RepID=A0A0G2G7J8_9PEZI|nr:hypothetical protein UCDDS831_g05347 [Diplodia seriata]